MTAPYLIKKYSSRRLYDVTAGRFVTLAEIFSLIRCGKRIRAVDAAGRDITRSILLQVLADQEEGRDPPLLSAEVLHEMVRMYGDMMQGLFARFLDEGLAGLRAQQERLRGGVQEAVQQSTSAALSKVLDQQAALWDSGQRLVRSLIGTPEATPPETGRPARKSRIKP